MIPRRDSRQPQPAGPARREERGQPRRGTRRQTVNELPQPQPPVAWGFLNEKPEPISDVM